MYYKRCPFCNEEVRESYNVVDSSYNIEHICNNGIEIRLSSKTLNDLQTKWNTRNYTNETPHKTTYGYLIFLNGDIINCDNSHPEELLNYFGIQNDFSDNSDISEYEETCRKLGILRISDHCDCLMLDIPSKVSKIQIDKCIDLLATNYNNYINFNIYNNEIVTSFYNINDIILYLDKMK